jgi:hypothetical protein
MVVVDMTTPHGKWQTANGKLCRSHDFCDGFLGKVAAAMVTESFAIVTLGSKSIDLPGLAQKTSASAVLGAFAFVVHPLPPLLFCR